MPKHDNVSEWNNFVVLGVDLVSAALLVCHGVESLRTALAF